jgi:hypothetical protein
MYYMHDEICDADTLAKLGIECPAWGEVRLRVYHDDMNSWDGMCLPGKIVNTSRGWHDYPTKPESGAIKLDSDRWNVTWFVPPDRSNARQLAPTGASRGVVADAHNAHVAHLAKLARAWIRGDACAVVVEVVVVFDGREAGSGCIGGVFYDGDESLAALALGYANDYGLASEALASAEDWRADTVSALTGVGV